MLELGERFYPVRHGFTHTDSAEYWDGSGNAHAVAAGRVGYSRLQQIWLFFCFDFSCATNGFRKLAKVRKGVHENLSLKKQKPRNVGVLLSRGTSMQLVYSFLGIFSVLVAALLDAWCHWSLQRDRTTPAEEIPGQCFGFWVKLRWTWWSPICCYIFFTHPSTVSQSFINEFFLSKQDVVGSSPKTPRLAVKSQDSFRSKFFPQRRVVLEIPKHISGLESEGDSFAEVMSMLFRPILIFPHLWPSWVLVVFSCIHFWNPEVYQANLVVWVFGPSAPPPL